MTASTVARGRSLLGERGEELDTLVIHPSVAYFISSWYAYILNICSIKLGGAVTWGGGGVGVNERSIGQFGMNVVIDSQVNTVAPGSWSSDRVPLFPN